MELTPEKALEVATAVTGKDGIAALRRQVEEDIGQAQKGLAALQVQIGYAKNVLRHISALEVQAGLREPPTAPPTQQPQAEPSPSQKKGAPPNVTAGDVQKAGAMILPPEVVERITKGLCVFKAQKTKKWCARKLRSKRQKETGYCQVHMTELGMK